MPSPALSDATQRRRWPDVGSRYCRTHRPSAAISRTDPAGTQRRRSRSIKAWRWRRLRARSVSRGHSALRSAVSRRRADHTRRLRRAPSRWRVRPRRAVRTPRDLASVRPGDAQTSGRIHAGVHRRGHPRQRRMAHTRRFVSADRRPHVARQGGRPSPPEAGSRTALVRREWGDRTPAWPREETADPVATSADADRMQDRRPVGG